MSCRHILIRKYDYILDFKSGVLGLGSIIASSPYKHSVYTAHSLVDTTSKREVKKFFVRFAVHF